MINSRSNLFHVLVNFFRLNYKQHFVTRQRFSNTFREMIASHQSWPVRKWPLPLYNAFTTLTNKKKKEKRKAEDYHKRCQHAEERLRAKSVTEVSSGLFWNQAEAGKCYTFHSKKPERKSVSQTCAGVPGRATQSLQPLI